MLKLKKISFKTYIFAKTNIYDSLADMALARGELEKAEGLYKETMKGCLQQGLAEDDNAIIELSIKVASIYAMLDRKTEAEQGLLFCIRAQDAKMMSDKSEEGIYIFVVGFCVPLTIIMMLCCERNKFRLHINTR